MTATLTEASPTAATPRTTNARRRPTHASGPGGPGLKSVATALDVLECFAVDDELGVSDIARRLGVAKSSAHRLLTTLCSRGLAEKSPVTGQYRLGIRLYELGTLAQVRQPVRQAAMPYLEELRERTGLGVFLSTADGADIVHTERIDTPQTLSLMATVGRRLPVHSLASGKAIAAFNPEVARARHTAGFPARTPTTIRSAAEFERALAQVRRDGYAACHGEAVAGTSAVAAPLRELSGRATAAIAVAGPTSDLLPRTEAVGRLLVTLARRLSRDVAASG